MNEIKCLFGFHNYTIPHKRWRYILICDQCLRFGHRATDGIVLEAWYEFDKNMTKRYFKMYFGDNALYEIWYDAEDNHVYERFS